MVKKAFIEVCGRDVKVEKGLIRTAHLDGDKYTFPDDVDAMIRGLRTCGTRVDLFTFLQRLPYSAPQYSYPMEWDNLAVLAVTSFEHWFGHQIRSVARNRARQASKRGVVFREVPFGDELVRGICDIYNESPVRLGKPFPHYGMTMERGREYAGTFLERSTYIGAFLDDKMIGFIKLVTDESKMQACLIHILSTLQHKEKAVTNALIGEAVRYCADHGIAYLVYEKFSYGKKLADSLSHFKEVNGFQRVDLPRYYIPLTALGRIAFRLGLHRRLADRIPESVASRFRDLRRAWYERKAQTMTEA